MRSYDEYKQILGLWELGINKKAISRQTGIPRRTIIDCIQRYGSVAALEQESEQKLSPILLQILRDENSSHPVVQTYAYLLGLYLGDGNIVKMPRTYRLRVTLDVKYPNIIASCIRAGETLLPDNRVGLQTRYL